MTITYLQAEKIRKTLQSLPELDVKERPMNTKELVLFLKSTIAEKKKQGYTLERLANEIKNMGVDISISSFKNYTRTKRVVNKQSKNNTKDLSTIENENIGDKNV